MIRHALLGITLSLTAVSPAFAGSNYAVSTIKYKNKGVYEAFFNIGVKYSNGNKVECAGSNTKGNGINKGKSVTIHLDNSDGSLIEIDPIDGGPCMPDQGEEVWGVVYLDQGSDYSITAKSKSCRKDGNKFYYHPDGGKLVVKSGGTLYNDNRCKLESKGGVKWDEKTHGEISS